MEQTSYSNLIDYFPNEILIDDQERTIPSKELVEIALAESSLYEYIKQVWKILEPSNEFIHGWHLQAICEHLEAVFNNQIKNIIINIPPRCMKSLSVAVFFPSWGWINKPSTRWLYSSYSEALSIRDSIKFRRLIQSLWYQARWGYKYQLAGDQNQKSRIDNSHTGYRISTSVGGLGTGEGGDFIIVDDPHNVKQAESDVQRKTTLDWWFETMSTRINNPENAHKIVVMQRLHENDLTGEILARELDYEHLCLPMEFEKDRRSKTTIFTDPRKEEGELLWKDRFGKQIVNTLKKELGGEYSIAGQLQQRPAPREGGMFDTTQFEVIDVFDIKNIHQSVRYWDKAGTQDGGAYTAGVLVHYMKDGSFIIGDVVRGQWLAPKREKKIRQTAILDGKNVRIWVEQEPGSGGKESAQNTIKRLHGYMVKADKVSGDKAVRAEPYADQVEIGNVKVLNKTWTKDFIEEHKNFPVGRYKDQVDAAAGAFNKLNEKKKRTGTW